NHVSEVEPKKVRKNNDAPIIEDWVSDDEEEDEPNPKVEKKTVIPTATKKEFVKPEKPVKRSVRYAEMYRSKFPRGNQRNWNGQKSNQLGKDFVLYKKACYICGSFNHLQYNCHNHQRRGITYRNNNNRVHAKNTHPNVLRNMSPKAVLLNTGLTPLNTVKPVYTAYPKPTVHCARTKTHFYKSAQSTNQRPFYKKPALTNRHFNHKINTVRPRVVNTARSYRIPVNTISPRVVNTARPNRTSVNAARENRFNVVKPSACYVWRPIKPNGASLSNSQLNDKGFVDSGCSRHMTGNIAHLLDFKDFDGGYVTFGGGAYGGRITGKGTIKTDNLDFDDVYFVKELKFNLFSVSQMCDKKNYVLFTDSECLVLSPNFKLPDENQILLKIPRQDNMYSFDMKNIVPKDSLTCLVAKATSEESMLWHRRLGHINFKNINKLVKENLVRDLPLKRFENDQTCVACLKGKQHRASCKTKAFNPITKPLFMLHMDLFGPTFVSSLMHKKYCLVVTDDYSRFSWVFFLTTKDETSEILKIFIKEVENLVDKKVKIIRSDNGTEFKNKVMDDFCREKGIKREYSVARTPQQNGVAERKNRTLIEAARTMLADSKLPTTFWAEAVSTACYVQNRVLIVKPHNKTPYELFREKTHDDSSLQNNGTDDQQVNTVRPEVNTGSREVSTAVPEVNTATPEDLVGPSPTSEDSHVENQEIELGNIPQSYEVPTTPHTRIHKDHPIEHEERFGKAIDFSASMEMHDDVDEHLYRSMIGSLMYLTASRPDIMFAVCARGCKIPKGKPNQIGLWYSKDTSIGKLVLTLARIGLLIVRYNKIEVNNWSCKLLSGQVDSFTPQNYMSSMHQDFYNAALASPKAKRESERVVQKEITASEEVPIVSTAEVNLSTAGETVTYTRRSAEKVKTETNLKSKWNGYKELRLQEKERMQTIVNEEKDKSYG
ncbi:putative ribonuclease H-like domain-containing protein, partial [Tanacetum coccineum]